MVSKKLYIGMDYEDAKNVFHKNREDVSMAELEYFTVSPQVKAYGIYPVIQVTGKNGKVVEILAMPDWNIYGSHKNESDIMPIWENCVSFAISEYGEPYKSKGKKKNWMLPDGSELKIKIEKGLEYTIRILIS